MFSELHETIYKKLPVMLFVVIYLVLQSFCIYI